MYFDTDLVTDCTMGTHTALGRKERALTVLIAMAPRRHSHGAVLTFQLATDRIPLTTCPLLAITV